MQHKGNAFVLQSKNYRFESCHWQEDINIRKEQEPEEKSWKNVRAKNNKGGKGSKVKSQQKLKGKKVKEFEIRKTRNSEV